MPLTLVTGRANAGKTGTIYGALRRAQEDGRRPVLLLPTRPDVVRARAELGGEGAVGLEIEQFDRYRESLWDLLGDGRVIVSDVERDVLLRRALSDRARAELEVSGTGRGLRRVLAQLIEQRAESGGPSPVRTTGPGSAVVQVLDEYERLLAERGRIEREEAFRLLARSEGVGVGDPLMVHRFSDLSTSQERFVVAASDFGADVWVSLPWEPGLPAATAVEPLASRLGAVGTVAPASVGSFTTVPELARLERGLFARPDPVGSDGAVDLIVAQGPGAEAEAIARTVSEHLSAGVRPEEVVVAFRDAGRHLRAVRRAFERAGIEADYDIRTPAAESPFGRALMHLWAFVANGMSRVDLVAFLRTPFSGADPDVVDEMDVRWRRDRVENGAPLLRSLASCPVAAARVRLARALVDSRVEGEAIERWRELADGLLASAYPGDAPLLHSDAAFDPRVHGSLLSAVSDLAGLRGEASSEDVMDSVREGLVAPGAVERPGRVQVTSVERLRSRRFEAVVLGGLTASEFPRGEAEDGSASEALSGAHRLMGLAPGARPAAARERLLYYEAVTRARRRLTLVRQESDDEGADVAPSVFWDETLDLYRDPLAGPEQPGLPRLRRVTAADLAGMAPRAARPPRSAPQGAIANAGVRARVDRTVFSVSDIETYLMCPYQWFHSRVVAPGTLDLEIDARIRGTLAHDALARFYRSIHSDLGIERVTPGTVAEALELAGRVTADVLQRATRPWSLAEEMALTAIGPLVSRLVSRDATFLPAWRPIKVEWAFGMDDEPHDFGRFLLRGRVDRIDDGPAGLVIVDYKTGSSSVTPHAKMLSGGKIQMPLYAAVASARLGRPVAGGLYRSLAKHLDRGFVSDEASGGVFTRTDVVTAGEIEELIEGAVALACEAVEGMRAGLIAPTPSPEACGTCIAVGFCGRATR